ncbi:PucR family transcriptional regulator [Aeromicrobium sp. JJY06]|uniref:PucR family transcriptional regulator n=1 Tax=Aeromicrobium sp. JJY06 TaxID=3373478 RepID=UPI00376F21A6
MTVTIDQLASSGTLGLTLVAGEPHRENEVSVAHSAERPDPVAWLTPDELLMTAGFLLPESDDGQYDYVRDVASTGAAGLAFAVGPKFDCIPAPIIAACESLGLPLLEVPASTPLVSITRLVAERRAEELRRDLRLVVEAQQDLTQRGLTEGIDGIVRGLEVHAGCEVALLAPGGSPMIDHRPELRSLIEGTTEHAAVAKPNQLPFSIGSRQRDGAHLVVEAIGVRRLTLGYLGTRFPSSMSAEQRLILTHAEALIALELAKRTELIAAEHKLRSDILRSILTGTLTGDGARRQLADLNMTKDDTLSVVIVTSTASPADRMRAVRQTLVGRGVNFLSCILGTEVVVVLKGDLPDLEALHADLSAHMPRRVNLGGSLPSSTDDLTVAVQQARFAVKAAQAESATHRRFDELSTYALLLSSQSSESLAMIASAALASLTKADDSFGGELLRSLEAYLSNNAQWVPAAAALGVHRHTLRNRMRRVEEITGRNLASAHDRTELWLALKAEELSRLVSE